MTCWLSLVKIVSQVMSAAFQGYEVSLQQLTISLSLFCLACFQEVTALSIAIIHHTLAPPCEKNNLSIVLSHIHHRWCLLTLQLASRMMSLRSGVAETDRQPDKHRDKRHIQPENISFCWMHLSAGSRDGWRCLWPCHILKYRSSYPTKQMTLGTEKVLFFKIKRQGRASTSSLYPVGEGMCD